MLLNNLTLTEHFFKTRKEQFSFYIHTFKMPVGPFSLQTVLNVFIIVVSVQLVIRVKLNYLCSYSFVEILIFSGHKNQLYNNLCNVFCLFSFVALFALMKTNLYYTSSMYVQPVHSQL